MTERCAQCRVPLTRRGFKLYIPREPQYTYCSGVCIEPRWRELMQEEEDARAEMEDSKG